MKNNKKGFIVPLLLGVIALLVIGGGVYVYQNKKAEVPAILNTEVQTTNQTPPVNTQMNNENSQPLIMVISPNGGETFKIGDKKTIRFNITGSVKPEYRVSLVLEPGFIPLVIIPPTSSSYEWVIPKNVAYGGDAVGALTPGSYKITASLYDSQPCVGECISTGAKLLSEDKSNNSFTITN